MADKKPTYTGNINHAGSQVVKAPVQVQTPKGNTTVSKGNDLRNGK